MFSLHHDKYIDAELKKEQYFSFFGYVALKVHKIEIFFGFDFEICIISLLDM